MGYMDNDKITQLKGLLEEAKIQIKAFSLPGLEFGRCVFENNPIIETDALRELEKNYAIEIPADYKLYLTKIGNGGSQPLCGMFSVEESLALNRLSESDMQSLPDTELIKRYKSIYNYDDDDEFYRKDYLSDYELNAFGQRVTFDDYFDHCEFFRDYEIVFPEYARLKFDINQDENYWKYFECMRTHLLIFAYQDDQFKGELAVVLDGKHKGEVVYLMSEGGVTITYTYKTFIDWLIGFYSHALKKYPLGNNERPYIRYIFFAT